MKPTDVLPGAVFVLTFSLLVTIRAIFGPRVARVVHRVRVTYQQARPDERAGWGWWLLSVLAFAWWWGMVVLT